MVAQWEKRGVALQHRDGADLSARCRGIGLCRDARSEVAAACIAQAIQAAAFEGCHATDHHDMVARLDNIMHRTFKPRRHLGEYRTAVWTPRPVDSSEKACRDDRSVLYQRVPRLFAQLALARGDGRYARLQRTLGHVQLLILDDWGLEPLNEQARYDLLEILEDRYGRKSTIITSQLPVSAWHGVIGDPTYADAILDRLVHNAHRIELSGDSLRRNLPRKA